MAGGILAVPHFALPNTGLCRSPYRCPCCPQLLFAAFVCLLVHCCTPSEMTLKLYVNVSRQANCNLLTISAASARTDSEARLWPASATLHTSPSLHGPRTCRVPTELVTVTACTFFLKKMYKSLSVFLLCTFIFLFVHHVIGPLPISSAHTAYIQMDGRVKKRTKKKKQPLPSQPWFIIPLIKIHLFIFSPLPSQNKTYSYQPGGFGQAKALRW